MTLIADPVEQLLADRSISGQSHQLLELMKKNVHILLRLVNQILDFRKVENGRMELHLEPFDLLESFKGWNDSFRMALLKKHIAFSFEPASGVDYRMLADAGKMERIYFNLLSNAVKFTERGNITLRTAYSNGVFTLEVSDTGCGITEQQREKIFCPFERLTNAATQDGFGLGLPIVKELVTLMEGKIYVESMTGSGSRFTVCIPLSKADEGFVEKDDILDDFKNLQDTSVLILDNDPVQLTMTRDMSVRYGIGCDTCRNVDELLNMMRERKYDLLITDMKMPDMNGYEVLELLRSSDIGNSRTIPIAVSTALDKSAEKELLAGGFCGCLFKPFSAKELLETISQSATHKITEAGNSISSPLLAYGDNAGSLERLYH